MRQFSRLLCFAVVTIIVAPHTLLGAELESAQWIWSPRFKKQAASSEPVFFRKRFELSKPVSARIEITCDNIYTLYVNGHKLAEDSHWESVDQHDLGKLLVDGSNVIAVRGGNEGTGAAGLAAKITVKSHDQTATTVVTDASWKTMLKAGKGWERPDFDDSQWQAAASFGKFGETEPWARRRGSRGRSTADRFTPQPGFVVEEVIVPGSAGSLVALAFDEDGGIIASREGGPLLSIRDTNGGGQFESISAFCDKVKNCQGILPLDGSVYVVGDGPDGTAFYRLSRSTGSEQADQVTTLFKFRGNMGEHGPHQPVLGPDGLIYLMIGNHAGVQRPVDASSPHHHFYDGELIEPKYEDANGHAAGVKAPGGTVIRTDRHGKRIELFVGGFRNAYDHAFNRDGELFTFDSDMEWDVNLPWYRPTRVNHLIPGAEFGWRSGWTKWPDYYVDSLPSTLDTGRGSPTGIEFYNHTRYPEQYHGALLMCDWSQGRVLAVHLKPDGPSYAAQSEVFLEGRPLNCSDIAVGPDGWVYIAVGGRGTQGSILRVVTTDAKPLPAPPEDLILRLVRQPQLSAAWSRKQVGLAKQQLGNRFETELLIVASDARANAQDRVQALELLQIHGPQPPVEALIELSHDKNPDVRGRAVYLLGTQSTDAAHQLLVAALDDQHAKVRRLACEALVRSGRPGPIEKLVPLLGQPDRFAAWAARRALEQVPKTQWQAVVLSAENVDIFAQGATSLMVLEPSSETVRQVLERITAALTSERRTDEQTVDLLRVAELALYRSRLTGDEVQPFRSAASRLYPASDWRVNRELVRLLVYLQDPSLAPRLVSQLQTDVPLVEKIHAAMYARFLRAGWTPELTGKLIEFYEFARRQEGGNSFKGYLTNAARDFLKGGSPAEQLRHLAEGAKTPGVTLSLVQSLSKTPSADELAALRTLDQAIAGDGTEQARELAKAVLMVLARGDAQSRGYLHQVFETTPDRRSDVAQAIATELQPASLDEADWQLLTKSLAVVEGPVAHSVLQSLVKSSRRADDPALIRQVILQGLKLQDQGGQDAAALIEHWTGVKQQGSAVETTLAAWQDWYRRQFPDAPDPALPVDSEINKYTFAELSEFLASDKATEGSPERGASVFDKASCVKCHRYGNRGEGIGPDLTNVSSRFQRKEILESVLFPTQVISDQFAAKTVLTTDGKTYSGLVGPSGDGIVVLQASAEKVTIANSDVDMIVASKKSAMPEGLFATLTLEEIADLFAYLSKPPAAN